MPYVSTEDQAAYNIRKNARAAERWATDPVWRERQSIAHKQWAKDNSDKVYEQKTNWRERNREQIRVRDRAYKLMKDFGLTVEQWDQLFCGQQRRCAACGSSDPKGLFWHTDHNPNKRRGDSGFIRGILCGPCNLKAGKNTTSDELRALADYLEKHQ